MRRLMIVGLLGVMVGGCSTVLPYQRPKPAPSSAAAATAESPCVDSLYLSLKNRPMEDLTDREYRYMMERDRACAERQRQSQGAAMPVVVREGASDGVTILAVLGALALIGLLLPRQ